ncbi:MAG: undecaprenyldiphospho-muramoylpentapeptide beta-N-acetylglucosaminyltransferase [Prevotellaceae bacterium]|jgi:UDP-N-acetylglucosamine--N-acetylmuramyl-(pentapeptide) pyrophosphoryl-undecaprenol N-acetylglucosamine transferase|nr:undecaprenyldiphospho-muramoylpentapeptide beta-N-acetylglucosaminyltransferase [Prevotellaceae bacterium]
MNDTTHSKAALPDGHKSVRVIISGGGTGGHVFPAIAIANALKLADGNAEILFVGAEGRMEMEKVPAAGYRILGLPVVGIQRKLLSLRNLSVPLKLLRSMRRAAKIVSDFKPDVAVGVGGYASAPILRVAQKRGIPTLIQEQNSYAGLTNKLLAKRAKTVCVAYEGMERFFPERKLVFTGNPVRQDLENVAQLRNEALAHFGLTQGKQTVLVIGGSLGARTVNMSVMRHIADVVAAAGVQLLWQVGKHYEQDVRQQLARYDCSNIKMLSFIQRMDYAYAAADVVITRAGAATISELCIVKKPCILVPSPNVAEDHQTANAMALVQKNAAILVHDDEAEATLIPTALRLVGDAKGRQALSRSIGKLAAADAASRIAKEVIQLTK